MLNRRLHRLARVYTCQNTTLLEITCRGLNIDLRSTVLALGQPAHTRSLIRAFAGRLNIL